MSLHESKITMLFLNVGMPYLIYYYRIIFTPKHSAFIFSVLFSIYNFVSGYVM